MAQSRDDVSCEKRTCNEKIECSKPNVRRMLNFFLFLSPSELTANVGVILIDSNSLMRHNKRINAVRQKKKCRAKWRRHMICSVSTYLNGIEFSCVLNAL